MAQATFITGGTMIAEDKPAEQLLGTDIQGGETHHLNEGT